MSTFQQYFVPWAISQAVSLLILLLAIKRPVWARYLFAVLFLAAGCFNLFTAFRTPEAYLMYAQTAIGLYREFIIGWFGDHITLMVSMVAAGQILIGCGMIAGGRWLVMGCLGIIVFLLSIAPLGIGSAFPFSITVSLAAYLVLKSHIHREHRNS